MKDNVTTSALLIDDHPIVQIGVASLLKRQNIFDEIDVATTAKEAVGFLKKSAKSTKKVPYSIIITDIMLPDSEISSLIEKIKDLHPKVPILVFTMASPALYFRTMVNLGVDGFLQKSAKEEELFYAIRTILKGGRHFSGDLVTEAMFSVNNNYQLIEMFTEREKQILQYLLRGVSSKEIAAGVNLHKSSVATYKARIYNKIGVTNSIEFFQWAVRANLIESS